jgi:hypothetical protein
LPVINIAPGQARRARPCMNLMLSMARMLVYENTKYTSQLTGENAPAIGKGDRACQ